MRARPLGGSPAPLAGDDLVRVGDAGNGANEDRLNDPALLDRGGELVELGIVEALARIAWIGTQELDRGVARRARGLAVMRVTPPRKAARPRPRRGLFSVRLQDLRP